MGNIFKQQVTLDTFTSDIDVGISTFGFTEVPFHVDHIEWQTPGSIGDHATVLDGDGNEIFSETASVAKQSVFKPFGGRIFIGLKVLSGAVSSGKILIQLG